MSAPLTPFGDRVVAVKNKDDKQTRTTSGLYLPDSAKEKSAIAKVVAVGSEVKEIKVGDEIIYKEYGPTEVKIDGVEYLVVSQEDVLAKMTKK